MAELQKTSDGRMVIDYMARDYDSILRSLQELIPQKLPEWNDYKNEADFGNVLLQLFAHMADVLSYYQDRIANESFLTTARERRSIIHHLRLIGYRLSTAAPASATLRLYVPKGKTDVITIGKGAAFATKSQKDKPSVRFEYSKDQSLTISCNDLPVDPARDRKYYDGIPVEEGRLIEDEIIGKSNGKPNQSFPLGHRGLILRSLGRGQEINKDIILRTENGTQIEEWTLQEALAFSREGQKDYTIEIDENDRATVVFGDGAFGALPPDGAFIKATYRAGGGAQGNVPPQSITTIVDAPQLALLGAEVTNLLPATGGADRESIEHAVSHAPGVFRSLKRAVTSEDYEALALDFKGVGKVRAEANNWNTVTLYVAPEGGGHVSDVLRANLLAYFEDKRPASTIIKVEEVDYVDIYVIAQVGIESYYSRDEVRERIMKTAGALLAFDNVDFGQTIYLSKFYEAIEALDGVEYVNITEFRSQGQPAGSVEPSGKIPLKPGEIPRIPDVSAYKDGIGVEFEDQK